MTAPVPIDKRKYDNNGCKAIEIKLLDIPQELNENPKLLVWEISSRVDYSHAFLVTEFKKAANLSWLTWCVKHSIYRRLYDL